MVTQDIGPHKGMVAYKTEMIPTTLYSEAIAALHTIVEAPA